MTHPYHRLFNGNAFSSSPLPMPSSSSPPPGVLLPRAADAVPINDDVITVFVVPRASRGPPLNNAPFVVVIVFVVVVVVIEPPPAASHPLILRARFALVRLIATPMSTVIDMGFKTRIVAQVGHFLGR